MSNISARYTPEEVENKWYEYWMKKDYFSSTPDDREAYSIVIPPPNVTGVLHMGHMLNNTIQDILIRKARQQGKNACWVPGTDHASIATEAKVVKMLREQGIKKSDLTRDEFLEYAFKWKDEYGGIILNQLKKLGASCDWKRTSFTMDEARSEAVIKAFVDLYNREKLYRKKRMVNWDPEAKTVLSNEEVIYKNENSKLYYIKYQIEGTSEYLTVATTRPETIMGDSAVAVNPEDPRYKHLEGKRAIVPIIGRSVPIIMDDYVDVEFGTGALKVTPAHDVNDHEIGERHNLEVIEIFNADATMSEAAGMYIGEGRFKVRKKFANDLEEAGLLVKVENHQNNVGRSERTNAVIEPRLSLQWYVDMESLAKPALDAVMEDDVEFFPKNQKNLYKHWMENIRDWCISRQLWWGHRIPAYYCQGEVFVDTSSEGALAQAQTHFNDPTLTTQDLKQDEDVLDTWFSSWLWPISVFDGWNNPEELKYYYPTSVLVTGWDIIFLWVARMVIAGFEWENEKPFEHVYFTGMVRDKQRRKMSKSLGNSPDALKLIADYGADGVRFGMLSCSPAGGDLLFDDKLVEQGRNFCNKIWNALRLIDGFEVEDRPAGELDKLSIKWIRNRMHQVIEETEQNFKEYRLSEALITLYSFVWNDFCSWYLEMIKPGFEEKISKEVRDESIEIFSDICTLLHPYMPFITEEIWHLLKDRKEGEDCIVSEYPKAQAYDSTLVNIIETAKDIVTNVRDVRNKNGLKMREKLELFAIKSAETENLTQANGIVDLLKKMAVLSKFELVQEISGDGVDFIVGKDQYFIPLELEIDVEAELEAKRAELKRQQGFVIGVEKKLSNERFVNNAPEQVVSMERKKLSDGQSRIKILTEEIAKLEAKS